MPGLSNSGVGFELNGGLTLGENGLTLNTAGSTLYGRGLTLQGAVLADPVSQWAIAVVNNGGTVSAGRETLLRALVADLQAAGTWNRYDDIFLLAGENAAQALTSLKQRELSVAVATPTFTADRGYVFNGTSSYLATRFTPAANAAAMSGNDMRIAGYERTNLNSAGYTAGVLMPVSTSSLLLRSRNGSSAQGRLNSGLFSLTNSNSLAMVALSRTSAGVFQGFYRGASIGTTTTTSATTLPSLPMFIGAFNNNGTAASFRAASIALVTVGASFTVAQEAADYAIWQVYMTAIGANV